MTSCLPLLAHYGPCYDCKLNQVTNTIGWGQTISPLWFQLATTLSTG